MNTEQVKQLSSIVRGRLANNGWDAGNDALAALTSRLLELEADRAGMTGTPPAEGWYVCYVASDGRPRIMLFAADRTWAHREGPQVIRFHRLPGEVYTPFDHSKKK